MTIPRISSSRWFIYGSTSLLVFLCLAVLMAALLLMRRSAQPRVGVVSGNSMEPVFLGPRIRVPCEACGFTNRFSADAWDDRMPTDCQCCSARMRVPDDPEVEPGQRVTYFVPRRMQKTLAGNRRTRLIERGDVVVIDHGQDSSREIKRVVALPEEQLDIREGDIWIDGLRYEKNLREWLLQAVLVHFWDRNLSEPAWQSYLDAMTFPLSNELPVNAHDSHKHASVEDFGIALRFDRPVQSLNLHALIPQSVGELDIALKIGETWELLVSGSVEPISQVASPDAAPGTWVVMGIVDRRIVIGNEEQTLFAIPLEPSGSSNSHDQITDPSGNSAGERREKLTLSLTTDRDDAIDKILFFRDLHYRGFRDSPEDHYDGAPGYFVLGDNVSLSVDSRGTASDRDRVPSESIRGIVVQHSFTLGNLLRQCDQLRPWPCHQP